jgi:hypothetical protein
MPPPDIDTLFRMVTGLERRQDVLELEVAFWKSAVHREKNAWTYAEEAVAAEYGIQLYEFKVASKGAGRCKGDQQPVARQAQFLLFSILRNIVGLNLNDIRGNYGPFVASYVPFWGELYNLVHHPGKVPAKDQKTYAQYAPRYAAVYRRMRDAMLLDGVWPEEFDFLFYPDLTAPL